MNTARQALHILRKDLRGLWSEIASIVLLNALLSWSSIEYSIAMSGADLPAFDSFPGIVRIIIQGLLIATWFLLIARLVQAEGLAGSRQHWLTRPYSRTSLLLSKLAGIVIVVHGLLAVTQVLILVVSGVPWSMGAVIVNQLILFALMSLPIALIAALTIGLRGFLVVVTALAIAILVLAMVASFLLVDGFTLRFMPSSASSFQLSWLQNTVSVIALGLIAAGGIVWQYRQRQRLRIGVLCGSGFALVALLQLAWPARLGGAVEARLVGGDRTTPTAVFRPDSLGNAVAPFPIDGDYPIDLPFEIQAAGAAVRNLGFVDASVRIRLDSGIERSFDGYFWGLLAVESDIVWLRFGIPRDLYDQLAFESVEVRARFDIRRYGEKLRTNIPVGEGFVDIDGRVQCRADSWSRLLCRQAYGSPIVDLRVGRGVAREVTANITYEAASLPIGLNPVAAAQHVHSYLDAVDVSLPVVVRAPDAYFRMEVTIDETRLADFNRLREFEGRP